MDPTMVSPDSPPSSRDDSDGEGEEEREEGEEAVPTAEEEGPEEDAAEPTLPEHQGEEANCLACDRPDSWDNMIMCDGPHEEQWYHWRCVGVKISAPKGNREILSLEFDFLY